MLALSTSSLAKHFHTYTYAELGSSCAVLCRASAALLPLLLVARLQFPPSRALGRRRLAGHKKWTDRRQAGSCDLCAILALLWQWQPSHSDRILSRLFRACRPPVLRRPLRCSHTTATADAGPARCSVPACCSQASHAAANGFRHGQLRPSLQLCPATLETRALCSLRHHRLPTTRRIPPRNFPVLCLTSRLMPLSSNGRCVTPGSFAMTSLAFLAKLSLFYQRDCQLFFGSPAPNPAFLKDASERVQCQHPCRNTGYL